MVHQLFLDDNPQWRKFILVSQSLINQLVKYTHE